MASNRVEYQLLLPVFQGSSFIQVDVSVVDASTGDPIDLTGATIRCQFRANSNRGALQFEKTIGNGITVTDAVGGLFQIDSFIYTGVTGTAYMDIEVTLSSGEVYHIGASRFPVNTPVTRDEPTP